MDQINADCYCHQVRLYLCYYCPKIYSSRATDIYYIYQVWTIDCTGLGTTKWGKGASQIGLQLRQHAFCKDLNEKKKENDI
jgi:hypothetical protein